MFFNDRSSPGSLSRVYFFWFAPCKVGVIVSSRFLLSFSFNIHLLQLNFINHSSDHCCRLFSSPCKLSCIHFTSLVSVASFANILGQDSTPFGTLLIQFGNTSGPKTNPFGKLLVLFASFGKTSDLCSDNF